MPNTVQGGLLIDANDMLATVSSPIINGSGKDKITFQVTTTNNDAVGTYAILGSNDGTNFVALNFFDSNGVSQTSVTVATGVAQDDIVTLGAHAPKFFRFTYTRTSGTTGNILDVRVNSLMMR